MKYILTLIILGSFIQIAKAQLNFKIEELSLSNYNVELEENVIDEDLENGPYVYFKCIITNHSEDTITLSPAKSTIAIVFIYYQKTYKIEIVPLPFVDTEILLVPPGKYISLDFGCNLLIGTDILSSKMGDYTKEMLVILPTLRIMYKDPIIHMYTDEIKSVVIK
jgi:hypothetical protein